MNKNTPKKIREIKKEKILFFTTELNMMLKSGISFAEALNILYSQEKKKSFKYILSKVYKNIMAGKTIFESMKTFENIFGENYISMVRIGETSSSLVDRLEDIIKDLEFSIQNQKKVSSLLIYPITVLIFTLSIISFLILNILPNFISIFEENNIELPLSTKIILAISNNFIEILIGIVLLILSSILLLKYINNHNNLKLKKDKFLFEFPFIKIFYRYSFSLKFYRNLSILLNTGINIDEIIEILFLNTNNLYLKKQINEVKKSIISGSNMAVSLKHIDFFEDRFFNLIFSGEKSGSLIDNLLFISEILRQDLEYQTKKTLTILEPLIMLFLGFIVGFIILAIYLPIISINNIF